MGKTAFLMILGLVLPAPLLLAQRMVDYGPVEKDLEDFIPRQMDKGGVKGLSIALADDSGVIWTRGFGFADEARQVPATDQTLFPVGALSKLFTAGEILKLAGEGKVDLDAPVQRYLPGFAIHSRFKGAKPITVRSLLANHSGLPAFLMRGTLSDGPGDLSGFMSALGEDYLTAPPQTLYKYSYVDYDLLGRLVEAQRKSGFTQAMEKDWLKPLGMDSSTFRREEVPPDRLARGYLKGKEVASLFLRDVPAAGLVSSAADMARFLCFALGAKAPGLHPPLRPVAREGMFRPQYAGLPLNFGHEVAAGWMLSGLNVEGSQGTAWHDGVYPPYVSEIAVLPQQKVGVVFLANSEGAIKVEDDILRRALTLMLNAKYGLKLDPSPKKVRMSPTVKVPGDQLDRDTGYYSAAGQLTRITRQGGHLSTVLLHTGLELVPISQDTFVPRFIFLFFFPIDFPENSMTFSTVEGRRVTVFNGFTYPIALEKIEPVPIPEAWRKRMGEYQVEDPEGWLTFGRILLTERDGFLTVDLKATLPAFDIRDREYRVALEPLSDGDALQPGLFYGDGGTLHAVDKDGATRIFYSGYWFKRTGPLPPGD